MDSNDSFGQVTIDRMCSKQANNATLSRVLGLDVIGGRKSIKWSEKTPAKSGSYGSVNVNLWARKHKPK
jgi:hypothetical protein